MNGGQFFAAALLSSQLCACALDTNHDAGPNPVVHSAHKYAVSNENGTYVGVAVAAMGSAEVPAYMERQRQQLQKIFADDIAGGELQVDLSKDRLLRLTIASDRSFDSGSAQMKPSMLNILAGIASVLGSYDQTVVQVLAYCDDTDNKVLNLSLSERRAASVASYIQRQGFSNGRIRYEGRAEDDASDSAKENQPLGRRVDFIIKPVVRGHEQDAWVPPP